MKKQGLIALIMVCFAFAGWIVYDNLKRPVTDTGATGENLPQVHARSRSQVGKKTPLKKSAEPRPQLTPECNLLEIENWVLSNKKLAGAEYVNDADDKMIRDVPYGEIAKQRMAAVSRMAKVVKKCLENPKIDHAEFGRELLNSKSPAIRTMGGILLASTEALDTSALKKIAEDENIEVPLAVCEWLMDFYENNAQNPLWNALLNSETSEDELLSFIKSEDDKWGGERAALSLLVALNKAKEVEVIPGEPPTLDENGEPLPDSKTLLEEMLTNVAKADGAGYDARMTALFALRDSNQKMSAKTVNDIKKESWRSGDPNWIDTVNLISEAMAYENSEEVPYTVYDISLSMIDSLVESTDLTAEAYFTRVISSYIDNAFLEKGEPVVEEGCWEKISGIVNKTGEQSVPSRPFDDDPTDRLNVLLDRIRDLDPAHISQNNPGDGENGEDEE